jgi:hypothetical protein
MRPPLYGLLAAITLPAVVLAAPPPAAPLYREIGDWILGCDNARACVAKAVPDDQGPNAAQSGYVRVTRAGGPAGAIKVWIGADDPFAPAVRLDGRPTPGAWTAGTGDDNAGGFVLQGEAAAAFLRAIRSGQSLRLAAGHTPPTVSLKGLAAVLLAMDDAQGRVGTVTALARPGPASASAVPPPDALPMLRAAPPPPPLTNGEALIAAVRQSQAAVLKDQDCDSEDTAGEADAAVPLNRDEAVVLIGCLTGAYQGSQLAFRIPRSAPQNARLLVLPTPPVLPKEEAGGGLYAEAAYDPAKARFVSAGRGRGAGDCGLSLAWVFDGQAFHLSDLAYQERCGGGAPGDWPTLYRSRGAP